MPRPVGPSNSANHPTGADQRPRAVQAMLGRELLDGLGAGGAVDVQDVEAVAGGEADVGLGVAGPPGQDPGPVAGGVVDPVGDEGAEGVLAGLAAARIPTRAASSQRRQEVDRHRLAGGRRGGEGARRGSTEMRGGIAKRRVPEQPAGAAHRASFVVEGLALEEAGGAAAATAGGLGQGSGRPGPPPAAVGHRRPAAAPQPCWRRPVRARRP